MNSSDVTFEASPAQFGALAEYLSLISSGFCSFLEAARKVDSLYFHHYTTDQLIDFGGGNLACGLWSVAMLHTESLRAERQVLHTAGTLRRAALLCDNLIVDGSAEADWRTAKDMLDWPHYILKTIYSSASLMFGKFWTHEEDESLDGRAIPEPPLTFLSIRSAVKLRDPRLLREQIDFAREIEVSQDDGADVQKAWTGIERSDLSTERLLELRSYELLCTKLREAIK